MQLPNFDAYWYLFSITFQCSDASYEYKTKIWQRIVPSIRSIETVHSIGHYSIFYVWYSIVRTIFSHSHMFPNNITSIHHTTMDLILRNQKSCGGFCHAPYTGN